VLSELALRFVNGPLNRGPLDGATHYGHSDQPGDGPYVQIWLIVEGGVIRQAAFKCPGCPSSTASAGVLCALISGREVEKALALTPGDLLAVVGTLPEGKGHYIERTIRALRAALVPLE